MTDPTKRALLDALQAIGEAHEFAVSGTLDLVLPGLHVEGRDAVDTAAGSDRNDRADQDDRADRADDASGRVATDQTRAPIDVALPVSPDDARALIAIAERAPFGMGEETVVDLAVRSVWQIGAERVSFANPRWPAFVDQIVGAVADALAIRRPIVARLYKLLIYETGSHFVAHKDTEKEDGMFATLVVSLPSRHRGGRLVVRHAGATKDFDLGGESGAFALQYAAFYTDCEHEIEPLTDGYRVALIYNLLLADVADVASASRASRATGQAAPPMPSAPPTPSAPEHSAQAAAVAEALAALFEEGALGRAAIGLEHQYSQAGLAPGLLKGADRARYAVLAGIAAEQDYACYLALLTHYQRGELDYKSVDWRSARSGARGRRRGRWYGGWDDVGLDPEALHAAEFDEVYEEWWILEHWVSADDPPLVLDEMSLDPGELVRDPALELPYDQYHTGPTGNEGFPLERRYRQAVVVLWPRANTAALLAREGPAVAVPALLGLVEASDPAADDDARRLAQAIVDDWRQRKHHLPDADALVAQMLRGLTALADPDLASRFIGSVLVDIPLEPAGVVLPWLPFSARSDDLDADWTDDPPVDGAGDDRRIALATPSALYALCDRLGWTPCRDALLAMVEAQAAPDRFPRVAGLVALLEALCTAGGPMTEPRRAVCDAAMEAFLGVLAALDERSRSEWRNAQVLDRRDVLAPLAIALHAIGRLDRFAGVVERALARPVRYGLRPILAPAVRTIQAHDPALEDDPAVRRLREHVVAELRAATASPPAEPTDWRQEVDLRCDCEDCLALAAFAQDPEAEVHRFKLADARRQHLQEQIRIGKLDMTHDTERSGSPQTLVCIKTRGAFERAMARHEQDVRWLEALGSEG